MYHDKEIFFENYNQMNESLKMYIYPDQKTDPFANVLLPNTHSSPSGNHASKSFFKITLSASHFITQDPSEADLFFLPFSIASMRHDKRIRADCIKNFIEDYISTFGTSTHFGTGQVVSVIFNVVLSTEDIPFLKRILKEIVDSYEYVKLHKNVLKVQNHFQWYQKPVDFDTFYMVMYKLWLRRSSIRIHLLNDNE